MTSRTEQVEVSIDELVLHGLPVADPAGFGDAVAASLGRLLAERGLPERPSSEPGPVSMPVVSGVRPVRLAEQVADAVWRLLGGEEDR